MMPNIKKGSYMSNLLVYLAGKGRANEHRDQRVIAGDVVVEAIYGGRPLSTMQAAELARLLDSPRQLILRGAPVPAVDRAKAQVLMDRGLPRAEAIAEATSDQNTWHCSLSLAPEEGTLSDETWRAIAHDFMAEMGFAHRDDGVPDNRWSAIHHGLNAGGGDHIHIAMAVVRSDGSCASLYRDHVRAQRACNRLEHKYGLQVLASREEGGTERATTPAERARQERVGAPETDREAMERRVRAVAAAAGSEAEWLRELRAVGILPRPRWEKGGQEVIGGYKVEMRPQRNADGKLEKALSFSGGYLAKDLTLPALRHWAGWDQSPQAQSEALAEWRKGVDQFGRPKIGSELDERRVIDELARFSAHARTIPAADRDEWCRAASQASGMFAALSVNTERSPGPVHQLARQLGRAGDQPASQRRLRIPTGPQRERERGLRQISRWLWATQSPVTANAALLYALTDCLLAVQETLAAGDKERLAAAMAFKARQSLTEIHMRRAGIDPKREYDRSDGSPAWVSAMRANAMVDRGPAGEIEPELALASQAWQARRSALAGRSGYDAVDEFGHITRKASDRKTAPRPTKSSVVGQRAGGVRGRPRPRPEQQSDRDFDR
ncbi:relaxase/mobilization nuclease domain-containing protein [Nocardia jinanensis]|uniref:MobA/VirD2-like nuclease domain-containing protein n=1 Tax=Nocardia jinanensis TaxID=382504 RepID=A0A917VY39_9NOCA|nr:relaxase/mobilization nuclease domain-containing protein [Nocardia jinanensis]GGL44102.1 hypothetical protein GCM10011588_68520 [Nocardia jinanensis]